jgi:hypothetical protein
MNNQSDPKLNKIQIKNILTCSFCKKLLHYPITLQCQDTFCKNCLKIYKYKTKKTDCPKCHKDSFYPPIQNIKLWDLIGKLFPDEIKLRDEEVSRTNPKLTEEEQIKEDIIKNNWRDVINKKMTPPSQPQIDLNNVIFEQIF